MRTEDSQRPWTGGSTALLRARLLGVIALVPAAAVLAACLGPASASAATIRVDTDLDSQAAEGCSLRDAVTSANTNQAIRGCEKGQASERDTISMKIEGFHGLSIPSSQESGNADGDLDVIDGGPLTIRGARGPGGSLPTGLVAPGDDRTFDLLPGADLTIERLEIVSDGVFPRPAAGGHFRVVDARLKLERTEVKGGKAGLGGAMAVFGSGTVQATRSAFSGNEALSGGAAYLTGDGSGTFKRSTLSANRADTSGSVNAAGGAVLSQGPAVTIVDSSVTGNYATTTGTGSALGGGVNSQGDLTIKRSLLQTNRALTDEPGVLERGGGIHTGGGSEQNRTLVENSTIAGNFAGEPGENGAGGGIAVVNSSTEINFTTFFNNTGGLSPHILAFSGPPVQIRASILTNLASAEMCTGDVRSRGWNVFGSLDDCGARATDVTDAGDAGLAVPPGIADNGGPTRTVAIVGSSPARDLVPIARCREANGIDQRGFKRPKGDGCDAGAYEKGARP